MSIPPVRPAVVPSLWNRLALLVCVNGLSSSPVVPAPLRSWILRRSGISVGEGSYIGSRVHFRGPAVVLGRNVHIQSGCVFDPGTTSITVGDGVGLSYNCIVLAVSHDVGPPHRRYGAVQGKPVVIEEGCWIGAGTTILPGVTVGRGAIVGAGAVVTRSTPPDTIVVGSPARPVRQIDDDPDAPPVRVG